MPTRLLRSLVLALFLSAVLAACGGGGGGDPPAEDPPMTPVPRVGVHVVTTANLTAADSSAITHPLLDGNPNARLLITQNWNASGSTGSGGTYNIHPVGVWYDIPSGKWQVINRDRAALPVGCAFNYRITTGDADSFLWLASGANITTYYSVIANPVSDVANDLLLFATHNWNPAGGPGTFNPDITAIAAHSGPPYRIINLDLATPFPAGTAYNISVRPQDSKNFFHVANSGNVIGNTTVLAHPLLDGNPGATMQVTPYWGGSANLHHIGVYYDGATWRIFNQDGAAMAPSSYNVSVD